MFNFVLSVIKSVYVKNQIINNALKKKRLELPVNSNNVPYNHKIYGNRWGFGLFVLLSHHHSGGISVPFLCVLLVKIWPACALSPSPPRPAACSPRTTAGASSGCRSRQTSCRTGHSWRVSPRYEPAGASLGSRPRRSVCRRCHSGKASRRCGPSRVSPGWTGWGRPCRRFGIRNSSCGSCPPQPRQPGLYGDERAARLDAAQSCWPWCWGMLQCFHSQPETTGEPPWSSKSYCSIWHQRRFHQVQPRTVTWRDSHAVCSDHDAAAAAAEPENLWSGWSFCPMEAGRTEPVFSRVWIQTSLLTGNTTTMTNGSLTYYTLSNTL